MEAIANTIVPQNLKQVVLGYGSDPKPHFFGASVL
jgi:hypothetical protein